MSLFLSLCTMASDFTFTFIRFTNTARTAFVIPSAGFLALFIN